MSDLTSSEKRKLERLLEMEFGHLLNFSRRTMAEFVEEHTGRDVFDNAYPLPQASTGSKASRLRAFWEVEPNHLVGKLIAALIAYRAEVLERRIAAGDTIPQVKPQPDELVDECRRIVLRLTQGSVVQEIDAIRAPAGEPDFETIAKEVHEAIRRNQPEAGLDRLHTFAVKFVRSLCKARGVVVTREKPLHSLFGEYVKRLQSAGHLQSGMTERILKSSISTLESFNHVRNEQSLAHDNEVLNYEESLLIFNHVTATIRFLQSIEDQLNKKQPADEDQANDDLPF
jgi:hypothetical protein